ncbi:RHS repeat-associated core domain-containing protein [Angustibacter sp. Root456]|uniref:RHS repeat-associated core domain-containing protein n=1 Tax=Angustibacter sp. Root456 TaxID=1736539 RepID=UPI0006FE676D|nr:RHS repeat-associated core domain-containing protein [Angustibacter sp. Root456]KQX69903.1 hypothetical protein ASD06_02550 [Angustibacter sp. Root456]
MTLALDAGGRRTVATTTTTSGTSTATSTLERHYADASDNPAWTVATDTAGTTTTTTTTRYGESLSGDLAATIASDGAAELTLANLHGDVVTTIDIPTTQASSDPATSMTGWADYSEYGNPCGPATTSAAVAGKVGYGWLGAKQRSTTAETAGLTLMGDRLYNPAVGAFTSTDPEPGGNTTAYTYPQDPINAVDLDGHWGLSKKWKRRFASAARGLSIASSVISWCPLAQCQAVSVATGLMAAGAYRLAGNRSAARRQLITTALNVAMGGRGRLLRKSFVPSRLRTGSVFRALHRRRGGLIGMGWRAASRRGGASYSRYHHKYVALWLMNQGAQSQPAARRTG